MGISLLLIIIGYLIWESWTARKDKKKLSTDKSRVDPKTSGIRVIVPQSDIDNLEKARLYLHKIVATDNPLYVNIISDVTPAMWKITHRRYEKVN